jgi:hypothetical protein
VKCGLAVEALKQAFHPQPMKLISKPDQQSYIQHFMMPGLLSASINDPNPSAIF